MNDFKKGIDISSAKVISEEKHTEPQDREAKPLSEEEKKYIENLQDQKEVIVSDVLKSNVDEKVKINFLDEGSALDFTASKSKTSSTKVEEEKTDFGGDPKKTSQTSASSIPPNDPAEHMDSAIFVMGFFDLIFSQIMKFWSKDTSDSAYSLPKPKQMELAKYLAKILAKYQKKFPIEFMFLMAVVGSYSGGFIIARMRRKKMKEEEQKTINLPFDNKIPVSKIPVHKAPVVKPVEEPLKYKEYTSVPDDIEELKREIEIPNEMETHYEENSEMPKRKYAPLKRKKGRPNKL